MIRDKVDNDVCINNNVAASSDRSSFICCMGSEWDTNSKTVRDYQCSADEQGIICKGVLEKKTDHKWIKIGPAWKTKYCVLNAEAVLIFSNKTKMVAKSVPSRTVPLCHIKSVSKFDENDFSRTTYFNVVTEQQEILTFRCKSDPGWVPQIQIQLIHYKVSLN